MELEFTDEQRRFRDELRAYLADMMTDALRREVAAGFEGGGPEFRQAMISRRAQPPWLPSRRC